MSRTKLKTGKRHKKAGPRKPISWVNIVALLLMLAAIFGYLVTIDESDPEALPAAAGGMSEEAP